jgi:predicted metal-dependent phosphoesterase TrpH
MLKFMRNKLINVALENEGTLSVYGVLDDDLYGLWLKVGVSLPDRRIISVEADWNRWTTPECWRAIEPLQGVVGMLIEPGLRQVVQKGIGRSACRHFANLFLECCHAAGEAAGLLTENCKEKGKGPQEASIPGGGGGSSPVAPVRPRERGSSDNKGKAEAPKALPEGGVLIDLHVHTSTGSPCSAAPVDDLIEEARRIGLDGICLTDHNHLWQPESLDRLRRRHGFLVFGGNEITTDQGDVLVFGLDRDIQGIIGLEDLRDAVLEAGGVMIAAHPFRGFLVFDAAQLGLTPEKAMKRKLFKYVDAVEVGNSKVTEEENGFAEKVAKGLGLPGTAGSDAHGVDEVGIYATSFSGVIKDEKSLVEALKSGDCVPVPFRKGGKLPP